MIIILLTLVALWALGAIIGASKKREAKRNNDLYIKKKREVRHNEADWVKWYDDILERKN